MPEGPEIRRIADALEKQVAGRVVERVFFGLENLKKWQKPLTGARIIEVKTYGKVMVSCFDNGLNVYSHNQLYGRWHFCRTNDYPYTKRQLRMALDCQGRSALLYSASDIAVFNASALLQHSFLNRLGPDVLKKTTTVAKVIERLQSDKFRNRQLGGVLTDQSFVAGLGNYLRCEILFFSALHPSVRSKELDAEKLQLLASAILDLARQSYQTGGITNRLQRAQQLIKQGATFEAARFYVFRRQGQACYRCGNPVEKTRQAGQAFYFCPQCQQKAQK